ncbi:hypothetical protein [Sabulicella rubraurantiaca]|uniref:hypothetical protein n=1 Tax=Sabulicella rubraurantiaca TaxID=2811429 RepID=UPI001A9644D1|nr:hypothetical protein [Sabulicella rubraurantiaca]
MLGDEKLRIQRYLIVAAALALGACASAEWHQENDACTAIYLREIPPDFHTRPVTRTRMVSVPTGGMNCRTTGSGNQTNTSCTPVTRMESVPYTEWVQEDLNRPQRQAAIDACRISACLNRFGNAECRPARSQAPAPAPIPQPARAPAEPS